ILHWDFNHFVVLTQVKHNAVVVHDPARGYRTLSFNEVSKHFTGVALELAPTDDFAPKIERQHVRLRDLTGRMTGVRTTFVQILLLAAALEVFSMASPWFTQLVVD